MVVVLTSFCLEAAESSLASSSMLGMSGRSSSTSLAYSAMLLRLPKADKNSLKLLLVLRDKVYIVMTKGVSEIS